MTPSAFARLFTLIAVVIISLGAWTVSRGAVLAEPNRPQQQLITVDDLEGECLTAPCRFELYFDSDHARREWFKDARSTDTTYNNHAFWADTQPARGIAYIPGGAIWRPFVLNSSPSGPYRVSAFIPRVATGKADTRCATYLITHAGGETSVEVNQGSSAGTWLSLGTYRFTGSTSEQIKLDWNVDNVTCDGGASSILFDAVGLEPVDTTPISVRAYLRDLPEGASVAPGTRVWHCFSVSRATPIRWWWQNPSAGWRTIGEWNDDGKGECRESEPLEEPGIRRTRIEALQDGQVIVHHETYFFVERDAAPSTATPRATTVEPSATPSKTSPPPTGTSIPNVSVWIESGCNRTQTIGQTIRVGVQADAAGIARLSFEPQGVEFAVRSLRAHEAELVDTVVQAPPGAQSVLARLEQRNQVVATASCDFRVIDSAVATPTQPTAPADSQAYLPLAVRLAWLSADERPSTAAPRPTMTRPPSSPTSTRTRAATATSVAQPTQTPSVITVNNANRLDLLWDTYPEMGWLETIDFSPSGKTLAWGGGGSQGIAEVTDISGRFTSTNLVQIHRITHDTTVAHLEVFDDGSLLAGTAGDALMAWNWMSGSQMWRRDGVGHDLAAKPDGTRLVSGGRLWNVSPSGLVELRFLGWQTSKPGGYTSNGVIGLYNSGIILYNEAGNVLWRKELPTASGWFHSVSFSSNHELVATSDSQGSTYVWRVADGTEVMRSQENAETLTHGAALSPAGDVVATAFNSGWVSLRSVATGQRLNSVGSLLLSRRARAFGPSAGFNGAAHALQFSPDGLYLAVGSDGIDNGDARLAVYGIP